MFVIGFKAQDPTSPKAKVYAVVATSTGTVHTGYGAATGPLNTSLKSNFGTTGLTRPQAAQEAIKVVQKIWNDKVGRGGYSNILIPPTVFEAQLDEAQAGKPEFAIEFFERQSGLAASRLEGNLAELEQAFVNEKITTASKTLGAGRPRTKAVRQRAKVITGESEYYRPNGAVYRPRDVNGHHDVALLRSLRTGQIPVRLHGLPGTGKTALVEAAFGRDLITINGHGDMSPTHLVGAHLPKGSGFEWADGPLVRAMKEGRPLFIDEITRIPTDTLAILYSVLDGRNTLNLDDLPDAPVVTAQPGFYVVCGYNPEGVGVRQLDDALISRFAVSVEVTTDYDAALSLGVPDKFINLAENMKTKNDEDVEKGGIGYWVPQMRELLAARDLTQHVSETFAAAVLLGQCPRAEDLGKLQEVAKSVFGQTITPLKLGGQV
ncbi:AAA family ATPase [Streptomyces goshikiensis]|uniref:AAA family ATPase n=1 Tax=Streptomyces goshikiensis TaxID=1942 RepID=UPI0036936CC1